MASEKLIRSRVFGNDAKPTIYYIVGFRMKIKQFLVPIQVLKLFGFRIVAFDIDPIVLTGGDLELLGKSLDQFMKIIKDDATNRKVAGAYGISLGSFFALNALTLPEIQTAALNTGGGSIVQAVWEMNVLNWVKQGFIKKGHDRKALSNAWDPIDVSQNTHKIVGKNLFAAASYADEFVPIKDALRHYEDWQKQGVIAHIDIYKHLSHKQLIVLNLLRIRKIVKFFK